MSKIGYENLSETKPDKCEIYTPQTLKIHGQHLKSNRLLQTKRCLTYMNDANPTSSCQPQASEMALSDDINAGFNSPVKRRKAVEDLHHAHLQTPVIATPSNVNAGVPASVIESTSLEAQNGRKANKRGSYKCRRCGQPKKGHVCIDAPEKVSSETQNLNKADSSCVVAVKSTQYDCLFPKRTILRDGEEPDKSYGGSTTGMIAHILQPNFPSGMNDLENNQMCSVLFAFNGGKQMLEGRGSIIEEPSSISGLPASPNCSSDGCYRLPVENSNLPLHENSNIFGKKNPCQGYNSTSLQDMCLLQIMSRLPPTALLVAGHVCRQWKQCAEKVWAAVGEAQLALAVASPCSKSQTKEMYRVTPSPRRYLPSVLQKCSNLVHLSISVSSQLDDLFLKSIASSRPELSSLEISIIGSGISNITEEGLEFLASTCKFLSCLKIEGCQALNRCRITHSELKTMWLSGCCILTSMIVEAPLLMELSLDFISGMDANLDPSSHNPDSLADLTCEMGKKLQAVQKLHLASPILDDRSVFNLLSARLRCLRMLSLVHGVRITDESASLIASSCSDLEFLDLSGSSITDKALISISMAFSKSLRRLLVAVCPKISEVGLQEAVAYLPLLELLDCGRAFFETQLSNALPPHNGLDPSIDRLENADNSQEKLEENKLSPVQIGKKTFRALVLQHSRLEKISFWGCSNLGSLILDCPNLIDLNLNDCRNLRSEDLVLCCPDLRQIHSFNCGHSIVQRARNQKKISNFSETSQVPLHLDGSKRVHAPLSGTISDCCGE